MISYPGVVVEQEEGVCQYLIEWSADKTTQPQQPVHMFGKLTKKRGLHQGDHVLALAIPGTSLVLGDLTHYDPSPSPSPLRSGCVHARNHPQQGRRETACPVL